MNNKEITFIKRLDQMSRTSKIELEEYISGKILKYQFQYFNKLLIIVFNRFNKYHTNEHIPLTILFYNMSVFEVHIIRYCLYISGDIFNYDLINILNNFCDNNDMTYINEYKIIKSLHAFRFYYDKNIQIDENIINNEHFINLSNILKKYVKYNSYKPVKVVSEYTNKFFHDNLFGNFSDNTLHEYLIFLNMKAVIKEKDNEELINKDSYSIKDINKLSKLQNMYEPLHTIIYEYIEYRKMILED